VRQLWSGMGDPGARRRCGGRASQRQDMEAHWRPFAAMSDRWRFLAAGELASTTSPRRPSVASSGSATPPTYRSRSCATAVCPYGERRLYHRNGRSSFKGTFRANLVPRGSASSFATGELLRATRLVLRQATLAPHPLRNKCSPAQGSTGGAGTAGPAWLFCYGATAALCSSVAAMSVADKTSD
jgi:hypothetical protein